MGINDTEWDSTYRSNHDDYDPEPWCNDDCDTCPLDGCCTYCCTNKAEHYPDQLDKE